VLNYQKHYILNKELAPCPSPPVSMSNLFPKRNPGWTSQHPQKNPQKPH
jgi:hypothetical protein